MPRTVFATFRTEEEAEHALALVMKQTALLDSAVLGDDVAGNLALQGMDLAPADRSACQSQLKRGGFLMIAQAETENAPTVLRVLQSAQDGLAPLVIAEAAGETSSPSENIQQPRSEPAATVSESNVIAEERIPLVEEELKIGKGEVVKGMTKVHSSISKVPVREQVELAEEELLVESRPAGRRLSDEEVKQSGLLQDRVIQFSAMREEAIVSKEAFVREEVVISKQVIHRTQAIEETLRRTEVETQRFEPGEVEKAE